MGQEERAYCYREIVILFLDFTLVLILSLRKLWGFLHLWFPRGKTLCQMNGFGLNMMLNQVIFGVDMFGLIMEFWILGQLNCKSVVNKERR